VTVVVDSQHVQRRFGRRSEEIVQAEVAPGFDDTEDGVQAGWPGARALDRRVACQRVQQAGYVRYRPDIRPALRQDLG